MVFVFGVDIPLVEMVFVLTLVLILLFVLLIYIMISQHKLNKLLSSVAYKANLELGTLKKINVEEKEEMRLLRFIRSELDKMLYGLTYGKKIEALMRGKAGKEKIRRVADSFWRELMRQSKKEQKLSKELEVKKRQLREEERRIERERARLEMLLKKVKKRKV